MGSRKRPKPNPKAEPLRPSRPESSEPTKTEAEALRTPDRPVSTDKLRDSETGSGANRETITVRIYRIVTFIGTNFY